MTGGAFGNYAGSCVVCMTGTDTGLGFQGELEWLAAALINLGVSQVEAVGTIESGVTDGAVEAIDGEDRYQAVFRVCQTCVAKTNFPAAPVLIIPGASIPSLGQTRS